MSIKNIYNELSLMRNYLVLLLTVIGWAEAYGQQNVVSLEESKKAALQYSFDIKSGKYNEDLAESAKREALASYLPNINAYGTGVYGFEDLIPAGLTGGIGIDNMYFAGVQLTLGVYQGGARRSSNELVQLQWDVSQIRSQQAEDSVILLTEQKYWQLVRIQEQQKVLEANHQYLKGLLKLQNDLLASGLIAKNDLYTVKVEVNNLLLQKSKLKNLQNIAILDFALFTGIEYDTAMVVGDSFELSTLPVDQFSQPDLALTGNSNYQLLQKSIEASTLQTKLEKSKRLPSVAVGLNGMGYGVFDGPLDSEFVPFAFGTVNIPISAWWGRDREKIKQRSIRERMAVNNLEKVETQLKLGIMSSWYNLKDSREKILTAQKTWELAKENLKVSRDSYESGLVDLTDLLNAQRMKSQAETELVSSFSEHEGAEVLYLFNTNQIVIPNMD
ncbi:TolC family protein [Reichenbachiella versicolor]|uniref:TolC family protein n=1 Tax=Reichenbachiella versicolor TaxID=1821036 RepID=UPI000D6DF4CB|nr:TolC family protein [Reichenbachiella versicolor]